MKSIAITLTLTLSLIALFSSSASLQAQSIVKTVAQYDENGINLNTPDTFNTTIPYATFTTAVSTGFMTNLGGVINFDAAQCLTIYPATGISTIKAKYGVGALNTMLVSFGNPVDMTFASGPQIPISNKGLLNQPLAAPLIFKLSPSNALANKAVGFTVLQQLAPQFITAEFIQAGGPTLVATQLVPVGPIPTLDAFIARKATVAGGIVAVRITVSTPGSTLAMPFAIDDLAFRQ